MLKRLSFACIVLFALTFGVCAEEQIVRSGIIVPQLELPSLDNRQISIDLYLGKKVVLLSFFTSWSDTCLDELKYLQSIYDENNSNVEVIAVSFDSNVNKLKAFVSKNRFSFPVLIDKKHSFIDKFQILLIPRLIIVRKNGVIFSVFDDFDDNIQKSIGRDLKTIIKASS